MRMRMCMCMCICVCENVLVSDVSPVTRDPPPPVPVALHLIEAQLETTVEHRLLGRLHRYRWLVASYGARTQIRTRNSVVRPMASPSACPSVFYGKRPLDTIAIRKGASTEDEAIDL